jgi:putative transcriptional regulator
MDLSSSGETQLAGKLLIAMPSMGDPRFEQTVVFMCDYSDEGAMGLVINKPTAEVDVPTLFSQLKIEMVTDLSSAQVRYGGPVEMGRGFVLHSPEYSSVVTTLKLRKDIYMTATLDVLEDLAQGKGPEQWLLMLGYAGWAAGQLEAEIAANGWLICDATPELLFDTPDARKWEAALDSLGVSPYALSAEGGRA